jgi:hypothetical protein
MRHQGRVRAPEVEQVRGHPVGGDPALLGFIDRVLAGVLVFSMRGEKIQGVHVIGDPRQLSFLRSQLA